MKIFILPTNHTYPVLKKPARQFLKVYVSEMPGAILLQFGMWGTDGGGHLYSKNHPVS